MVVLESEINAYRCTQCSKVDAKGSYGPHMTLDQDPCGLVEWHHHYWYCGRHSLRLWKIWQECLKLRDKRLERIERWKQGKLEWQKYR